MGVIMTGSPEEEHIVRKTTQQIKKEAAAASCQGQPGTSVGGVHPPVEPVPDVDWVGETWGLYWPDIEGEIEEKKEDPEKYLKKHYPDNSAEGAHPPATETAVFIEAPSVLQCAKEPTPPPVPKEATPPPVKLRPKKVMAPPPEKKEPLPEPKLEVFSGPKDIDNDNSKWNWMRSSDESASTARFRLSIFW